MASWDIQLGGVQGVLTKVEGHANDLGTAANSVATDLENCANAIGESIVAKALSDFANARAPELTAVANRITTAMTNTVAACTDYANGNLTMAANAQAVAAQTPQPPGPHGAN
jgi:hypothetical protein